MCDLLHNKKKLCQYHGVQRKKQLPEVVDIWEPHIGREGDDLLGQRLSPCSWSRTNRRSTSTLDVSSFDMFRDFGDIKQGNLEKIWMTSCCLVMQLEIGCKVVEIEIPTADGYPVASWWDCRHCGKMWNCTDKVCSVPVFLVIPSLLVCAMLESWWVKQRQALHRHVISLSHVQQQAMTSFKCSNRPQCTTKHFRAC